MWVHPSTHTHTHTRTRAKGAEGVCITLYSHRDHHDQVVDVTHTHMGSWAHITRMMPQPAPPPTNCQPGTHHELEHGHVDAHADQHLCCAHGVHGHEHLHGPLLIHAAQQGCGGGGGHGLQGGERDRLRPMPPSRAAVGGGAMACKGGREAWPSSVEGVGCMGWSQGLVVCPPPTLPTCMILTLTSLSIFLSSSARRPGSRLHRILPADVLSRFSSAYVCWSKSQPRNSSTPAGSSMLDNSLVHTAAGQGRAGCGGARWGTGTA